MSLQPETLSDADLLVAPAHPLQIDACYDQPQVFGSSSAARKMFIIRALAVSTVFSIDQDRRQRFFVTYRSSEVVAFNCPSQASLR